MQFFVAKNAPQQTDAVSCSVFLTAFFLMFLNSEPIVELDVTEFRSRIKNQLLNDLIVEHEAAARKLPRDLLVAKDGISRSSIKAKSE